MHKTAEVTLASAETPNEVKKDAGHSKESEGAKQKWKNRTCVIRAHISRRKARNHMMTNTALNTLKMQCSYIYVSKNLRSKNTQSYGGMKKFYKTICKMETHAISAEEPHTK